MKEEPENPDDMRKNSRKENELFKTLIRKGVLQLRKSFPGVVPARSFWHHWDKTSHRKRLWLRDSRTNERAGKFCGLIERW
jgi:hypothetical protein